MTRMEQRVPNPGLIRPGDQLRLGPAASPQFVRPVKVAVIRVREDLRPNLDGWCYIDAYELDDQGEAAGEPRRALLVRVDGVDLVSRAAVRTRQAAPQRPAGRLNRVTAPAARTGPRNGRTAFATPRGGGEAAGR